MASTAFHVLHSDTMKGLKTTFIVILSLLILTGVAFFLAGKFSPKPGGIRIETTPNSSVFINGSLVGETPYNDSFKAGTMILRLVPKGSGESLVPFETSITLEPGIETIVGRNFGTSEDNSSGYIISFQKTKAQTASLVVISQPTNAQVLVDGVSRGFSTYDISAIAPAKHTVTVKSPEYSDFSMTVNTLVGYRLTFYVKLGQGNIQENPSNSDSQKIKMNVVTILDTPTGYLRVRSEPGSAGEEIAQVKPGETFPYLDTDVSTGWIEIQYEASKSGLPSGIAGWISGSYATVSAEVR
ncbi:MAG: hypothetical protein UU51_C0002G0017 [Microgenomates group bacterium GW2011_GWC1_41_20]|uniref:SH3b domain-containing protein n=7 Tax=Candidatus Woeseibacteriota TaxID=1752722 RepID=A0A0G0U9V6_9BACT|nr:MAG: hypothetical protein UT76_C0002G0028 [Candidatus Woesebacteria bacterium GW2011_GWB1_40_12]KKR56280.1 MAG: hypothetical protein UT93_C0001G0017 [Candidatus Woesebacteria bacterium GW2011_GWF1_40_24]KKR91060.1 MAG: hypothetical protein UU39_C0001G0006 [Candidatus Woesebacteria bacterium GW2011_GWD1_41_12]KKS00710.1 MAG: hypothetical protein UU51_C0002G0017 [Microgenomates group bacterium GW2011_GWC1_41_20]KKS05678.1 MAG: hypothetical protein UU57_C0002G0010 [Candidatus Woesebacteria bact